MPTIEPRALRRGDVVLVRGRGKERPAIVVSIDVVNRALESVIVVPTTTQKAGRAPWPHEVLVPAGQGGLREGSFAQPQYVTYVDELALAGRIGHLGDAYLRAITFQLMLILGHLTAPTGPARGPS